MSKHAISFWSSCRRTIRTFSLSRSPSFKSFRWVVPNLMPAMLTSSSAQGLEDRRNLPRHQAHWHATGDGEWLPSSAQAYCASPTALVGVKIIRLISWNIDMMTGFARERMAAALQYLDKLVTSMPLEDPILIFFQEMTPPDLKSIRESSLVKSRFHLTDFDSHNWFGPRYGTTALVDRRFHIQGIFRVPWRSDMNRDGLFVDLALFNELYPDIDARTFRLCNVHLESLVVNPSLRPVQMAAAAQYLNNVANVPCALVAGDFNAIQPFDRTLHTDNDLKDTYLELGGQEDSEEGYTWGPQARRWSRERFGCKRMDKVLFSGCLQPKHFSRIGMGVKVADEILEEVEQEVEGGFVTDHYGVMGDFELTDGWRFANQDGGTGSSASLY